MSPKKYDVSVNGEVKQKLEISEVLHLMTERQLGPTDYIYNEEFGDWQMLIENQEVVQALKQIKIAQPEKPTFQKAVVKASEKITTGTITKAEASELEPSNFAELTNNPMMSEWYVLKGENKFGPFSYIEVIKMLQEKVVFEFDFAWQKGMESWVRIAELREFCPEHIKKLQDSLMPEIKNVFFRRKHPRVHFKAEILIHDNNHVWKGKAVELSEGGAGLIMENALVIPGQKLYLHFKPYIEIPAFNAIAEVVSKKYVEGVKEQRAPICYGVKFTNLSGNTKEYLQKYTKEKSAA